MGAINSFTVTKVANSQDLESNTSKIHIKWKVTTNGSTYNNYQLTAYIEIDVNGTRQHNISIPVKLPANTETEVYDEDVVIDHDDAGVAEVIVVSTLVTNTSVGELYAEKELTLDQILRVSTLTGSNGTLGESQKLVINRKADTLKHRITYNTAGESKGYVNNDPTAYLTGDSYTWTPPLSLSVENTTGTTVNVTLTLWTYTSDGTHLGNTTLDLQYSIPDSVVPTISQITVYDRSVYYTSDNNAVSFQSLFGYMVQGLSKPRVTVTTEAAYGSEIVECKIEANGATFTMNPADIGVLKFSGELDITVTVKDKRGRTATKKKPGIYALAYTPPRISKLDVRRSNSDGTPNDKGGYVSVTFSAEITKLNQKNTSFFFLEYWPFDDPDSVRNVLFSDLSTSPYTYSVVDRVYTFAADVNKTYIAKLTVKDVANRTERSTNASTAFTLMNFHQNGTAIGFGKVAEHEYAAEFGISIYDEYNSPVYGWSTLVNMLLPVGTIVLRYDMANPGELYPGTLWTQITDRVLRAVGTSGTIGAEGSIDSGGSGGRTYIDVAVWKRTE